MSSVEGGVHAKMSVRASMLRISSRGPAKKRYSLKDRSTPETLARRASSKRTLRRDGEYWTLSCCGWADAQGHAGRKIRPEQRVP